MPAVSGASQLAGEARLLSEAVHRSQNEASRLPDAIGRACTPSRRGWRHCWKRDNSNKASENRTQLDSRSPLERNLHYPLEAVSVRKTKSMRLLTLAGPPTCGKSSVLLKALQHLQREGWSVGVAKLDCLVAEDQRLYERHGIAAVTGLSGPVCPDHYFATGVQALLDWGQELHLDLLATESAGLCARCSPYITGVLAVCVIDVLSGVAAPRKLGPMLKLADIVVITKADVVSQAEREVFAHRVRQVARRARILEVNGLTGQGTAELAQVLRREAQVVGCLDGERLRFPMPAAVCSYCLGETRLGRDYQIGNLRKLELA